MKEIKCSQCGRILSHPVDNGHHIEGYYLYNQKAYCSGCWDKNETGIVVLAKKNGSAGENGETTWVVINNASKNTTRSGSKTR